MYQNVNTIKLDNNFTVLYVQGLDGGGHDHLPDFRQAVTENGKSKYASAVEWCAGFGVIGFDFLNRNVCDHISFVDYFEPAIQWLNETAKFNKIEDKVSTFTTDKISAIPDTQKWDLVLANPPHSFDLWSKKEFEKASESEEHLETILRITYDEDLLIHKEFFANIRKNLLPGADVFISEVGYIDEVEQLAIDAGLEVGKRSMAPCLSKDSHTNAVILHFKEPG